MYRYGNDDDDDDDDGDDDDDVMYQIFSTRWLDMEQFWRRNLTESWM